MDSEDAIGSGYWMALWKLGQIVTISCVCSLTSLINKPPVGYDTTTQTP